MAASRGYSSRPSFLTLKAFTKCICTASLVTLFAGIAALAQNPIPLVNQPLVPQTVAPGGPQFTLTVNGSGFVSGATVNWNGAALATMFVNTFQLKATVPVSDVATAGTASVTVTNPGPGGGTSAVQFFTITNPTNTLSFSESEVPGTNAQVLAIGDFNNDGKLDVIEARDSQGRTCVLPGSGDGGFGAPQCFAGVQAQPTSIVVGDFNRDGILDVAELGMMPETADVFLGNGDGTFGPPQQLNLQFNNSLGASSTLVAADFNRDGKLDLLLIDPDPRPLTNISFFAGNGDGTFSAPVVTTLSDFEITSPIFADFNKDEKLDMVDPNLTFSSGNGDGTFQTPVIIPGLTGGRTVASADMNGDGIPDLVLGLFSGSTIAVLFGNGDGTFQNAILTTISSGEVDALALGDLNGDGKLDIAAGDGSSPQWISLLLGNGDGTFQNATLDSINVKPLNLLMGDFNGDGKMDLIATGSNNVAFAVFLQGAFPGFSAGPSSLNFAAEALNTSSPAQLATITNTGTTTMTVSNVSIGGPNSSDFAETNTCSAAIPPRETCQISVTFTPTAAGTRTAAVSITDNAPGSPQSIPLSGDGQDFSMAPSGSSTAMISPGQTASYTVALAAAGGFKQAVSLTCSGAPAESTCSVPSTATVDSSSATIVTVTVTTEGPVASLAQPIGFLPGSRLATWLALGGLPWLAVLGGFGSGKRPRRRFYGLAFLCLFSMIGTWSASGAGSNGGGGGGGTPPGSYNMTVTGSFTSGSTTLTHSVKLTLIVQ